MEPQHSYTKGDSPAYIFNPTTGNVVPRDQALPTQVMCRTETIQHGGSSTSTLTPLRAPGEVNTSYSEITLPSTNQIIPSVQPGLLVHRQTRRRSSQLQITRQILELGRESNNHIIPEPQRETGSNVLPPHYNTDTSIIRSVAVVGPNNAIENRQQSPNEVDGLMSERSQSFVPMCSPGPSLEHPPDCAPASWKIVIACAVLNACSTVSLLTMEMCVPEMTRKGIDSAEKISRALSNVRLITAPVTFVLIIHAGYRHICMLGGIMIGLGFFISGFFTSSMSSIIGFLVAGIAGLGMSFWYLSVIIALLEYFTDGRLLALILSHVGTLVATVIMVAVRVSVGDSVVWETAFKFQLVPAVLGFGVSLIIIPLPQTSQEPARKSFLVRFVDALDPELFRNSLLYWIMLLLFLDQFAKPIPATFIPRMMSNTSYTKMDLDTQPFMSPTGVLVGLIFLLFWRDKNLGAVLFLVGGCNIIIGYLTLQLPDLTRFVWIACYSVLFGINEVVIFLTLHSAIPEEFGRLNIRLVAALFAFAAGVGRTASIPSAESLDGEVGGQIFNSFYLSGAVFITSGVLAFVIQIVRTIKTRLSLQNDKTGPTTNAPEVIRQNGKTGDTSRRIQRNPYQRHEDREDSDVVDIEIEDITNNNPPGHM